jgi:hypothetical protein
MFKKSVVKIQVFFFNMERTKDISHKDQYTFMIVPRSVLLTIRNVSDKSCRENQNTYFNFNNFFFSKIIRFVWKYTVQPDRPQKTIWRMHIACWLRKATNTLRICSTYSFSTARIVVRRRLQCDVHCLSW